MKLNKLNGWVGLQGLQIKANIGVYENEKQLGNLLEIDVWVYGNLKPAIDSDSIANSFNYELLEKIVDEEVRSGNHLLEPVAKRIMQRILEEMPSAKKSKIEIKKLNPPLGNPCNASVVKFRLKRSQLK